MKKRQYFSKVKIISIICFSILILIQCNINTSINREVKDMYKEILPLYPPYLTSHFPDLKSGSVRSYYSTFPRGKYKNGMHVVMEYTDEEMKDVRRYAEEGPVVKYHFTDSCLMIVDYDPDIYSAASFHVQMCDTIKKGLIPISNFEICFDRNLSSYIYPKDLEEATIYVLAASGGKHLDDEFLSKDGVGLSQDWLHGFTAGIAITKNNAIYWLEVW